MTHPITNALAMRTAAAAHCNDRAFSRDSTPKQGMAYRSAARHILALPLEADHAALLAEAVRLPEIAALLALLPGVLNDAKESNYAAECAYVNSADGYAECAEERARIDQAFTLLKTLSALETP